MTTIITNRYGAWEEFLWTSKTLVVKYYDLPYLYKTITTQYGVGNFVITGLEAAPLRVNIDVGTDVTIRCDWYHASDLAGSLYSCYFYLRDMWNNTYGPYAGEVTKEASTQYYATLVFNPTTIGPFDIRAEVYRYA